MPTKSNKVPSITASRSSEPFWLQAARGQIIGHTPYNANGYNSAVGSTEEGVWANGAAVNWPATASVMNVTSSSANDASAGTGARTVTVYGIDSNWDLAEESVTMNGVTIVATTTSFIRVHRVKCTSFGSGATNAGVIYVFTGTETSGVPDTATTVFTTALTGQGESLQAFVSVPRNMTAYILDMSVNVVPASGEYVAVELESREGVSATAGWNTIEKIDTDAAFYTLYSTPVFVPQKSDIVLNAAASSTTARVSGGFNVMMISDLLPGETA